MLRNKYIPAKSAYIIIIILRLRFTMNFKITVSNEMYWKTKSVQGKTLSCWNFNNQCTQMKTNKLVWASDSK